MAQVPPFITKANPWNRGTSCSINCDWLFHCKSLLKECEYSIILSVFMTKFQTDFASSVWSVCHWVADVPFHETSLSGNEQGKRSVFTGWVIEQLRCPFCFILLLFPVNVVVGYQVFSKVFSRWQKLWRRWRWKKLAPVSRAVQGLTPSPHPLGKFLKSRPLTIHFQHSGARIRVFEQNTDSIKFWLFYSVTADE